MTQELVLSLLGWSTVVNFALLLWWFAFFALAHDWMYRLHGRWFNFRIETFDAIHYGGMGLYKMGIILFNLVPYLVLRCLA